MFVHRFAFCFDPHLYIRTNETSTKSTQVQKTNPCCERLPQSGLRIHAIGVFEWGEAHSGHIFNSRACSLELRQSSKAGILRAMALQPECKSWQVTQRANIKVVTPAGNINLEFKLVPQVRDKLYSLFIPRNIFYLQLAGIQDVRSSEWLRLFVSRKRRGIVRDWI